VVNRRTGKFKKIVVVLWRAGDMVSGLVDKRVGIVVFFKEFGAFVEWAGHKRRRSFEMKEKKFKWDKIGLVVISQDIAKEYKFK